MVKINDKVLMIPRNEMGIITDIKEQWTSYPHGSGTYYNEYKIKLINGSEITCDDWGEQPFISVESLLNKNEYLKDKISTIFAEMAENNEMIKKLS